MSYLCGVKINELFHLTKTNMTEKVYKTKEEAREAFRRAVQMRSVWEQSVREKWSKAQAEANGLRTVSMC